ncbi:MAG TPA: 3-oxoadipate enol-lactonase [Anaeromyxobacteraceae bacterium]|nr:3-oxoadipate enol-lactonase [Anaeromyxobacteraceae bacterium]
MTSRDGGAVRVHYRLDGPARAPVVLLSHALGCDLRMWDPQLPLLGQRYRVLRYDTRGHGSSPVPSGPCTLADLGRDVLGLLDDLALTHVHFCGLSLGGMVGLWLALRAPARIGRLILCDTAARIGTAETWSARIDLVRSGGTQALVDASLERFFTEGFRARRPPEVAAIRDTFLRTSAVGYAACCGALRDADLRAEVERVEAPTLVITGARDPSTPPSDGRFLADHIRGAQYVELEAAHLANVETPRPFSEAVDAFLCQEPS